MALDVVHDVLDGADLLRLLVRDLHVVFLLEGHHELDDVERVGAQVFDERRLRSHLILAHPELLTDDLLDPLLHASCHPVLLPHMYKPPFTSRTCPVTYPASGEARKA